MAAKATKKQVSQGAKYLDKKDPEWFQKINKTVLAMESNLYCVLGQLGKGSPISYMHEVGLTIPSAEKLGFTADLADEVLDALWLAEIDKRLAAGEPVEKPKQPKKPKKSQKK